MQLMHHQAIAPEKTAASNGRLFLYHDMGTGKTITILNICQARPMRTLVVCPLSIVSNAWLADAAYFPNMRVLSCRAKSKPERKRIILSGDYDIICANPEMVKIHEADFAAAGIARVVVDESSMMKNYRSAITQCLLRIVDKKREVYLLSGTPALNGPDEWWAQLKAVAPIRDNYWQFCSRYFIPQKITINGRECIKGWKLRPTGDPARESFERILKAHVWSIRKEDVLDLPGEMDVMRCFDLSPEEREHYDRLETELSTIWEGEEINVKAQAILMKLRQVTGGGMLHGESHIRFGQSKLDELSEVLEETGDKPVVIWCAFRADIDAVIERLGPRAHILDGRIPDSQRQDSIRRFGQDVRYLVCHPKAVGHGITLVQSSYDVFYSLHYSSELYHQARGRIYRKGQKNVCTHIHLCARDTADIRVLKVLQRNGTAAEAMRAVVTPE